MAHDEPKNGVARCSFCGKPETLVHKLIEGPGVFICDECINLCYDLIEQTSSPDIPHTVKQSDNKVLPKPEEIKARMGYLSNNTKLYEKFSVREFLTMLADLYDIKKDEIDTRIDSVIDTLGMQSFADNRVKALSTGQTQRVSIARCLFADPDLYILDEPTLGLDIMSAAAIVDFMKSEKEKGKTIIYSTHYLEEAETLCDKVILINKGHIIAMDSPKKLCEKTNTESLREAFLTLIREDGQTDEME